MASFTVATGLPVQSTLVQGSHVVAQQPAAIPPAQEGAAKQVQQVARMSDVLSPPGGALFKGDADNMADLKTDSDIDLDFSDHSLEHTTHRDAVDTAYAQAKSFLSAEYERLGQKVSPNVDFAASQIAAAQINETTLVNEVALQVIKELNLEDTEWNVKGYKELVLFE